jgi:predicted nucleotidyltransferase
MNTKEQYIVNLIKSKIRKKNSNAEVILFGSHARGEAKIDSDWDILILLDTLNVTRKTEKEYREELFDVELEIGEPISTFVYSKNDWEARHSITPLYKSIKRDGIVIQ